MMGYCENEDRLAFASAHQIGHQVLRHGAEKITVASLALITFGRYGGMTDALSKVMETEGETFSSKRQHISYKDKR